MSLSEKFATLMATPNQQQPGPLDDHPLYLRYGVRILGIVGAFFCVLFGMFNALSLVVLNIKCLVSGIIQILIGFIVMVLEAPCCCICIDNIYRITGIIDNRPIWYKAGLYCIVSIFPVLIYFSLGSLFPCALIFGTGVIYGMMGLGKKAPMEAMRQTAVNSGLASPPGTTSIPRTSATPTTNDRAPIIKNQQSFSFTDLDIQRLIEAIEEKEKKRQKYLRKKRKFKKLSKSQDRESDK